MVRRVETIRGSIDRAESSKSEPIKAAYSPSVTSGKPLGYGIDFGTSNSAVSIAYADRVEILPIGPTRSSRTLPSFVYLHRSGQRLAGSEGVKTFLTSGHEKTDCWRCPLAPYGWDTDCRQYRKGGGCNDARLLSGVKHELAKIGFAGTNSWAVDFSVATLVSVVLKRLKTEADEATGHATTRLVLGHPVVFAGADRAHLQESEAEAFKRLREAAIAAGGELLDGVLFETVVGPALGLDRLPYWLFNDLRTASSVRLVMADPGIPSILARIGGDVGELVHALLYKGHAYDFYRAIEAAKIELSDSESAALTYAPLGLDVPIRRSAFESMIRPELDTVKQTIVEALNEAGVTAGDVDRVLVTGGSGQIPAFRGDLAAMFGETRLEQRDAFTAVVHGLGVRAQQSFSSAASARG